MVAIARHLNVTLIVPELDKASFWADPRYVLISFLLFLIQFLASRMEAIFIPVFELG